MTMIALTANAVVGARESYLEAGFEDYLSKPIEVEKLEEKFEKHLPAELVEWRKKGMQNTEDTQHLEEEILEFMPDGDDTEALSVSGEKITEALEH